MAPAYPPCAPCLQHSSVFWVHFSPRLSFGARFGWHGTGPVQTTISLSLLYLISFIPRNEWHENLLNSQILRRVTRPKIKMGTPLSGLQSYPPPPKSSQTMQGKCSSLLSLKTKAWAELLSQSQWGGTTADFCESTSDLQDHADTGRLKAG